MGNYYQELIAVLREAGCTFVRFGKGDHEIWYSPIARRNVTVPTNLVKRHTANGILKEAGLPKRF